MAVVVAASSCAVEKDEGGSAGAGVSVERGEYLAFTSGCVDCHTPGTFYGVSDLDRELSGSDLGWQGPWGVTFPTNLTPDQETGIGSWTEEEIVIAIRTGQRPDGTQLNPPMPWPSFSKMTDDDAYSIAAYLKSIPAIRHQTPAGIGPGGAVPAGSRVLALPIAPEWDAG